MEGLIPYLIDVIKNQQHKSPAGAYRRSFSHSDSSNGRSYHLLLGASDSFGGGSSHRRTRSDLPPSMAAAEFSEHRYGNDGFLVSPRDPPPSNFLSAAASPSAAKSAASSSQASQVSRNSNNIRNRKY